MKHLIFIFLFVFSFQSLADFQRLTFEKFEQVLDFTYDEIDKNSTENLLIVFNIDRTLLETVDCLDPKRKFKNGFFKFEEKVRKCNGYTTSDLLESFVEDLKKLEIPVMALTARRDKILEPTLS